MLYFLQAAIVLSIAREDHVGKQIKYVASEPYADMFIKKHSCIMLIKNIIQPLCSFSKRILELAAYKGDRAAGED